ncbi:uncharacterized protein [Amphiura filiformis]|uniref:uncharacterized protein n=1 Tax=Amphiura filiformis TaxID=82378 RepID=UPI003B228DCC
MASNNVARFITLYKTSRVLSTFSLFGTRAPYSLNAKSRAMSSSATDNPKIINYLEQVRPKVESALRNKYPVFRALEYLDVTPKDPKTGHRIVGITWYVVEVDIGENQNDEAPDHLLHVKFTVKAVEDPHASFMAVGLYYNKVGPNSVDDLKYL